MDLQAILNSHEPIGLAASILKDGEPFFQGTSGWAEREKTKVMLNTTFELASCSKQFTGYCIQLLQNQGLLSITDPISKYFPLLQPNVKIQNLLWHTSHS